MKTYVLTLSKIFPRTHARAGKPTNFKVKFYLGQGCPDCDEPQDLSGVNISDCNSCVNACHYPKIHTIRANYELWRKRIKEVQEGQAVLSIRQWTGKSYRSKQVEIARLTANDGVGIQKLELTNDLAECIIEGRHYNYVSIAKNDGLHPDDWLNWFSCHNLFKPMAIIHFTKFRY
ncbi:hypothetical protein [Alloprevotella tannerae]|uniref:hypothetical protein n=1 Tax=Alloprevotella tannerae TaxID=76122 RepID=UPI0028E5384B|nr:hypothetical protein [Alloprevotella tannerae]